MFPGIHSLVFQLTNIYFIFMILCFSVVLVVISIISRFFLVSFLSLVRSLFSQGKNSTSCLIFCFLNFNFIYLCLDSFLSPDLVCSCFSKLFRCIIRSCRLFKNVSTNAINLILFLLYPTDLDILLSRKFFFFFNYLLISCQDGQAL